LLAVSHKDSVAFETAVRPSGPKQFPRLQSDGGYPIAIELASKVLSDKRVLRPRLPSLSRVLLSQVVFTGRILLGLVSDALIKEKPVSIVCSKCKKSLSVKESIFKAHKCGHLRSNATPRVVRKTGDYVKSHFSELIAIEMRKTVA
jgi:hypothetical protein